MRGKLSDQDLTNYALNDGLDPGERLYVESLLAVSEECRQDIYAMIDVGQLLEEGFEQETDQAERIPVLTAEQRNALLDVPDRERHPALLFFQKAAAVVAMAALLGFAVANPMGVGSKSKIARVSSKMTQMVTHLGSATNQDADAFAALVDLHELVDDSSSWVQTANDSVQQAASTCTPPSWNPEVSSIH